MTDTIPPELAEHRRLLEYIEQRDLQQAQDYLNQQALALEVVEQIGHYALDCELQPLAQDLFEMVYQSAPKRAQSYVNLGRLFLYTLEYSKAQASFEMALNYDAQHEAALAGCERARHYLERRLRLPSIYLNTLPKSGSMYLFESLKKGLGLQYEQTSSRIYFTEDRIIYEAMLRLAQGGCISQEHLPAHPWNLYVLKKTLPKMIVHVRDPRQACLSWAHHCQNYFQTGQTRVIEMYLPANLPQFFEQSLTEQLDWHLRQYYPLLIDFIQGWMQCKEEETWGDQILLTRYQDFAEDNQATLQQILSFYEIDPDDFDAPVQGPQAGRRHFRKGQKDEWRSVFTTEQIEWANERLTPELRRYFNWLN